MVLPISDKTSLENKLTEAGDNLVVLGFSADWCHQCVKIAPQLEALATQHNDVHFLKVDIDRCEELAHIYQISVIPSFVFIKKKTRVASLTGALIDKVRELVLANK